MVFIIFFSYILLNKNICILIIAILLSNKYIRNDLFHWFSFSPFHRRNAANFKLLTSDFHTSLSSFSASVISILCSFVAKYSTDLSLNYLHILIVFSCHWLTMYRKRGSILSFWWFLFTRGENNIFLSLFSFIFPFMGLYFVTQIELCFSSLIRSLLNTLIDEAVWNYIDLKLIRKVHI